MGYELGVSKHIKENKGKRRRERRNAEGRILAFLTAQDTWEDE